VEGVEDTGEFATVYNLRVADFHTYFVGCDAWGFSVWAHNADYAIVKGTDGVYTIIHKETGSVVKVANYVRFETLDQAKRFVARYQIEADVDLARTVWRPPKRWNGPGAEKGEWLGSRGNSGWVDNRPEVQKIVNGEPIPFVEGKINFDKWA